MTDILITPDELDPTNGDENNNLQNNSEENTQPENAETSNGSGRRHYRRDNKQIASLKNIKSRKQEKLARLTRERDGKKADLERGYINVQLGDDSERVKQVGLEPSDKEMIRSVIAEKEYEIYELGLDIDEIDVKIRALATAKKSSFKKKLSKKKQDKNENDMVKRIDSELDKASKNGSTEIVSKIKQQVRSGKKDDAYDSLKSFLSQKVKPVAKKLDKDAKLEKNVLDKVIEKLSTSQS
jgi:hypothetical protein